MQEIIERCDDIGLQHNLKSSIFRKSMPNLVGFLVGHMERVYMKKKKKSGKSLGKKSSWFLGCFLHLTMGRESEHI